MRECWNRATCATDPLLALIVSATTRHPTHNDLLLALIVRTQ